MLNIQKLVAPEMYNWSSQSDRMIYALYGLILLTAVLVIVTNFDDYYDQHIDDIQRRHSDTGMVIDQILADARKHLGLLQSSLLNPTSPPSQGLPALQYAPQWDGYIATVEVATSQGSDRLQLSVSHGKNPTDAKLQRELRSALSLAPAMAMTLRNIPDAMAVYYLSGRGFLLHAPWVDPAQFHFNEILYDLPFYQQARRRTVPDSTPYWTEAYSDRLGKGQMVTYAVPIYEGERLNGMLAMDMTLRSLSHYLRISHDQAGDLFIVNALHQVLAHPRIADNSELVGIGDILPAGISEADIRSITQQPPKRGKSDDYLLFSIPLREAPWHLVAYQTREGMWWHVIRGMRTEMLILLLLGVSIIVIEVYRRAQRTLRISEQRFRQMADLLPEFVYESDADGRLVYLNRTAMHRLGYRDDDLISGIRIGEIYQRIDSENNVANSVVRRPQDQEYRVFSKDGHEFPALVRTTAIRQEGHVIGERGVIIDISEIKSYQQQLQDQAMHDSLTGCFTHRVFMELAHNEIKRGQRRQHPVSLLMMDLDNFKHVNDRWGHRAGDATLEHFVALCRRNLRAEDLMGRMGGEEFAVLCPETGLDAASLLAERIRSSVEQTPAQYDGQDIAVTVSIGVTEVSPDGIEASLSNADMALYEAKGLGRNRVERHS
jgi:diguanylate cyclase (GGDEF)-like protein/PAS domain S-box-containing protein